MLSLKAKPCQEGVLLSSWLGEIIVSRQGRQAERRNKDRDITWSLNWSIVELGVSDEAQTPEAASEPAVLL